MERRFESVFDALDEGRAHGRTFGELLRRASIAELVGALAAAGGRQPIAANAIATELLNRYRRLPFLGSFVVSSLTVVLIYLLDFFYTGTFLLLDSGARANILVGVSLAIAIVSFLSLAMWRGRLHDLRARFARRGQRF